VSEKRGSGGQRDRLGTSWGASAMRPAAARGGTVPGTVPGAPPHQPARSGSTRKPRHITGPHNPAALPDTRTGPTRLPQPLTPHPEPRHTAKSPYFGTLTAPDRRGIEPPAPGRQEARSATSRSSGLSGRSTAACPSRTGPIPGARKCQTLAISSNRHRKRLDIRANLGSNRYSHADQVRGSVSPGRAREGDEDRW
jgi:hypothetical protein